jgi:hypothetical protein
METPGIPIKEYVSFVAQVMPNLGVFMIHPDVIAAMKMVSPASWVKTPLPNNQLNDHRSLYFLVAVFTNIQPIFGAWN